MTPIKYLFASVMGIGYNKNVLYQRPITLAKR